MTEMVRVEEVRNARLNTTNWRNQIIARAAGDATPVALVDIRPGDLIFLNRTFYYHVEVYLGDGDTWGSTGFYDLLSSNRQTFKRLSSVLAKAKDYVILRFTNADDDAVRIRSRCNMSEAQPYNLFTNNCEHYAFRAVGMRAQSVQTDDLIKGVALITSVMGLIDPVVPVYVVLIAAPLFIVQHSNLLVFLLCFVVGVRLARYAYRTI